jgi:hypothetical protein
MPTSQSRTWVSSSVHAGLVAQSIPWTPRPAARSSPRIDGPELFDGKYAKKFGDCQCVMPGRRMRSTSSRINSKSSPCRGGSGGSAARMPPGSVFERTGSFSTRSM